MNLFHGRAKRIVLVALLAALSVGIMGLGKPKPPSTTNPPTVRPVPGIPEPAGFVVFAVGAGIVGLALHRRSRRRE